MVVKISQSKRDNQMNDNEEAELTSIERIQDSYKPLYKHKPKERLNR